MKTSGGNGLHVLAPIKPRTWEVVTNFAQAVALAMSKNEPTRYTAIPGERNRRDRIFIDYLSNSRGATTVAPYCTRAHTGARVSMPVDSSELGNLKGARRYIMRNVPQRLSHLRKHPWTNITLLK